MPELSPHMSDVPESMCMDLNADLGEGFGIWQLGDDAALLEVITSANVACGFHAGDGTIMRRVCRIAAERGVVLGAQVSYRDLSGFGRRRIDMPTEVLADEVLYQLAALDGIARTEGSRVAYVKPHGALNNATVLDVGQAEGVVQAVVAYDRSLAMLAQPSSQLERLSREAGLDTVLEAFPDRAYESDGQLVSRRKDGAVLHDAAVVAARAVAFAREKQVVAHDGSLVRVAARSLCVHGDSPGAVETARSVRSALEGAGFRVTAFR